MSSASTTIDHHHDHSTATGIPNKKLMMWAFLASDCMFFGCLIATHLIYRLHPPPDAMEPRSIFSIELTSFSTFILLMSSLMMALAVNAIQKNNLKSMRASLLTTVFFGVIFLGCQVYEFQHFVHEKGLTITNSILGTTFFTLTGTHGIHVAIGIFWLILMYVRSFQPRDTAADRGWFWRALLHIAAMIGVCLCAMLFVVELSHSLIAGDGLGTALAHTSGWLLGFVIAGGLALNLARPRSAVDFGEANAIDVESMGLYWHFVDIVWIVIFTAVYLLEYL
ncbi:cytochrome oxidase subunit III [Cephaloticoccus primus]|uniref:cytochrome-c oxidase n=1 Tax=Cephaloticoccus primus TaxID=1548207 RepID=A0A139SJ37_9BACT|nr:heme-copper oxidase subunit III [Cephaloticoccus primus]KXU34490.1 cytochrome oxidase subunit III [Cephaloticoccus primus]